MRKNKFITILLLILISCLLYTTFSYNNIKQKNTDLTYRLKKASESLHPTQKKLNDDLISLKKYLIANSNSRYATVSSNFQQIKILGIKTIDNYAEEKDYNKFKGTSYGLTATYSFPDNSAANIYIIQDTTKYNGNLILSDTINPKLTYYSMYKVGDFILKVDIYNDLNSISNKDWSKIYRFISELKYKISVGINV